MSQYDALHQILGKTIKGVVLKQNDGKNLPAISLFLVFTDESCCEIYSLYQLSVASRLAHGGLEHARACATAPEGPMRNVLDISLEGD